MEFNIKFLFFVVLLIVKLQQSTSLDSQKSKIPPIRSYLIENELCNIPYFDPWAFKERYENKSYVPCAHETPPVRFQKRNEKIYAILNEAINGTYKNNSVDVECCISNITRNHTTSSPDDNISESECLQLEKNGDTEITNDVVRVLCRNLNGNTKVYEDIHGLFVPNNLEGRNFSSDADGYSVLLIIIDSLSQANFLRHLKKTRTFLIRNGYINLRVYNQVGKDALPNILPLLTGYSHRIARLKFGNPLKTFFDDYPFIFKDFEDNGYVTAYAQDYSEKHAFNGKFKGFNKPPTSYYFRSYTLSSDKLRRTILDKMPHCTGPSLAAERILNLALDFAATFRERAYFGLFWLNSFSRDDFNAPGRMDEKLVEFFKILQTYQTNTFTFFLSDNGYYYDDIPSTIRGWFESRMPFHYVYVPETFRLSNTDKYKLLNDNVKKLISPYDIYATLQDILGISRRYYAPKAPKSCKNCTSIFKGMPEVRSCGNAGIDRYWCTCLNKKYVLFNPTNETSHYFLDV